MTRASFVTLCAVLFLGCVNRPIELDSDPIPSNAWQATLAPVDSSPLRASAVVEPLGTRSRVTILLTGSTDGSLHRWHIHQGSCGDDSPLVGSAAGYTPIPVGGAGRSQLITVMPFVLERGERYFVHVYGPATYAATGSMQVAACGALMPLAR